MCIENELMIETMISIETEKKTNWPHKVSNFCWFRACVYLSLAS